VFCDLSTSKLASCGMETLGSFVQWSKSETTKQKLRCPPSQLTHEA
jgi:hypothetical protein